MSIPNTENGLRKRVTSLEENFRALVGELNTRLSEMKNEMSLANEVINALTELVGAADVERIVEEARASARRQNEARQAENVKRLVECKVLVPQEAVEATSTVVTKETTEKGQELRGQYNMGKITDPGILSLLLAKRVGDTVTFNGSTATIMEIYSFDEARAEQVIKEEAEKSREAATTAELAQNAAQQLAPVPAEASVESVQAN